LDRDSWYASSLTSVVVIISTILLIPNDDIAWNIRLEMAGVIVVVFLAFSAVFFLRLRNAKGMQAPPKASGRWDWLAKFERRNSRVKVEFWQSAATAVGGGLVMIYLGFAFPLISTSGIPQLELWGIFATFEIAGGFLFSLGTLRVIAESRYQIQRRRLPRIARSEELARWLKDFDEIFRVLGKTQEDLKRSIWNDFSAVLSRLIEHGYLWTPESRERIQKLADFIESSIPKAPVPDKGKYLEWLRMLDNKDKQTFDYLKTKFAPVMNSLYEDPDMDLNADVIALRQEYYDYSRSIMDSLVNDAVNRWSDGRFSNVSNMIDFRAFKDMRPRDFDQIRGTLLELSTNAADPRPRQRAYNLYKLAKSL